LYTTSRPGRTLSHAPAAARASCSPLDPLPRRTMDRPLASTVSTPALYAQPLTRSLPPSPLFLTLPLARFASPSTLLPLLLSWHEPPHITTPPPIAAPPAHLSCSLGMIHLAYPLKHPPRHKFLRALTAAPRVPLRRVPCARWNVGARDSPTRSL
jgi:hypothetical protein